MQALVHPRLIVLFPSTPPVSMRVGAHNRLLAGKGRTAAFFATFCAFSCTMSTVAPRYGTLGAPSPSYHSIFGFTASS